VEQAGFEGSDLMEGLKRNFNVVCPKLAPVSKLRFKRCGASREEVTGLLSYYSIRDYVPGGVVG
jgi:hypothetical protein